jgi:hypothetical protein
VVKPTLERAFHYREIQWKDEARPAGFVDDDAAAPAQTAR